jgi:hypothetical protein
MSLSVRNMGESGLYATHIEGRDYVIRVTGKTPFLTVTHCYDLTEFNSSGELKIAIQALEKIQADPNKYLYDPINLGTKLLIEDKHTVDILDYTPKDMREWAKASHKIAKSTMITRILVEKGIDWNKAESIYEEVVEYARSHPD